MANESKPLVTRLQEFADRERADLYIGHANLIEEAIAAIDAAESRARAWEKSARECAAWVEPIGPASVEAQRADRDMRGPNDHESSGRMFRDEEG